MSNLKKWLPAILAFGVFIVLLLIFLGMLAASKPRQVSVLAAARALKPGDVITTADLQTVQVYDDPRAAAYVPADRLEELVGGVVLQPVNAGDPIPKLSVAAVGTADTRLTGLLADFPGMVLFPLPLDLNNVTALDVDNYHVGDIVSITVVYTDRPTVPENPAAMALAPSLSFVGGEPLPTPAVPPTPTASIEDYTERGKPPVAKTFPLTYRVVAIYGQQEQASSSEPTSNLDTTTSYASVVNPPTPILLLLIPYEDVEPLSLALSQGRVFVSLALEGHPPEGGFSYWDFEAMLKAERNRLLEQGLLQPTPMATPNKATATPTPTPTPTP